MDSYNIIERKAESWGVNEIYRKKLLQVYQDLKKHNTWTKYVSQREYIWVNNTLSGLFIIVTNRFLKEVYSPKFIVFQGMIYFAKPLCLDFFSLCRNGKTTLSSSSFNKKLIQAMKPWTDAIMTKAWKNDAPWKCGKSTAAFKLTINDKAGQKVWLRLWDTNTRKVIHTNLPFELPVNDQDVHKLYQKVHLIFHPKPKNTSSGLHLPDGWAYEKKSEVSSNPEDTSRIEMKIPYGSFLIRSNIFRCMHNGHDIEDINAIVTVFTKSGDVRDITVSAGYCRKCNLFFIMDSVFNQVKRAGRPLCNIVEYTRYRTDYSKYENNSVELKPESILKMCGYSVSEADGLTARTRHKILANMVDRRIITRQGIISYLQYFIRMRNGQSKFYNAINKWEEDIHFISHYQGGSYQREGIRAIQIAEWK